ncbi:hypothetical protein HY837_01335 [archaeon]|nr:hypothetical protein [archaeon]
MKTNELAVISIILAAISWIPLVNFGIAPAAVYFGWKGFKEIKKEPELYKGKIYAIIGMLIGLGWTVFSYYWWISGYF